MTQEVSLLKPSPSFTEENVQYASQTLPHPRRGTEPVPCIRTSSFESKVRVQVSLFSFFSFKLNVEIQEEDIWQDLKNVPMNCFTGNEYCRYNRLFHLYGHCIFDWLLPVILNKSWLDKGSTGFIGRSEEVCIYLLNGKIDLRIRLEMVVQQR